MWHLRANSITELNRKDEQQRERTELNGGLGRIKDALCGFSSAPAPLHHLHLNNAGALICLSFIQNYPDAPAHY